MASYIHALAMVVMMASSCCSAQRHSVVHDGREVIEVDHAPDGVVWAVQLSDLHVSSYHADRALSLQTLVGPLLALINPSLVLITGDLTDAKSKDRKSRRQDEAEWVQYRQAISKVIEDSGLPSYAFYDLRGNHDKFGVPEVGNTLDYFSKYSVSSLRNRTNTVQSVTLMSRGWKHLFLGVDTSMGIGLRGPCNLFGHPTDEQLIKMDLELSQWDTCAPEKITKVAFGHFPMSFTASTERRKRLEPIFSKHSISAYVCGHLHTTFGPNLIKHHLDPPSKEGTLSNCKAEPQDGDGEFWEWEMGDWRKSRILRIIAIDQGHTSFMDFDFSSLNATRDWLPALVVPTYPLDSQKMERSRSLPLSSPRQDMVRALVFSPRPLVSVVARFFDTVTGELLLLEDLEMHVSSKAGEAGYMYVSEWNSTKYTDQSPTRYVFQVSAVDSLGTETKSSFRPFSVKKRVSELKKTWREFFVMGFVWEQVFVVLMWSAFTALLILFILPKLFFHFLTQNGYYHSWFFSLFRVDTQKFTARKAVELFAWFFIQGCAGKVIWWGQLLVLVWLIFFPWFWGQALAEGSPLGFMSIRGWTVRLGGTLPSQSGLGWPDLMVVVLPYLYFVVLPLYTLIFALSAETSLHKLYLLDPPENLKKKEQADHVDGEMSSFLSSHGSTAHGERDQQNGSDKAFRSRPALKPGIQKHASFRWLRMLVMALCLLVSFIHFGQVCALAGSYGVMTLLASPGFAWPVPILMIAAVLQSSACRRHK